MESSQGESAESSQGELTREKLMQKCKTLLTIAQKAKVSRDEALEEKIKLLKELEDTRSAMCAKDNQFKAVEEMLGVLTDQKLKLAMDIDTLKKEKVGFANQVKQLTDEKEQFEAEALSLKRQYDRLLTENEDLIGELQLRERSEKQLLSDIKKLHENNESVKILCTNVTQEKLRLEDDLEKLGREMEALRQERNTWNQTLCSKYGFDKVDLKSLVDFVDKKIENSRAELTEKLEFENDESLAEVLDQLDKAKKENELIQEEAKSMKEKIQRLVSELETANVDRDQMMANLEGVRIETKTLIENVEKLSEEVDSTKVEKQKSENALNKIVESKNEEIDALLQELSKHKAYVSDLMASMNSHVANGDKSVELNVKLKCVEEENAKLKIQVAELSNDQSPKDKLTEHNSSKVVESCILQILKEGICSNLSDLNDTMPEYSKEFLDKLNSIIEGADCKGEIGADVFVHYFNECLSQLKISLKENEILTKEVSHQKGSIKELEGLVEKHNTDCEQLRSEVEELSSDSNRLLHDLGNLRQENLLRVSEIGELMVRLKQRNDDVDRLKEVNNQLENEHNEQISNLRSEMGDANSRLSQLQELNRELEVKLAAVVSDNEAVRSELESSMMTVNALRIELEKANIANQKSASKLDGLQSENKRFKEDIHKYTEKIADLNSQLSQKSEELENALKRVEAMSALEDELKHLKTTLEEERARSLEAEKLQDETEALRINSNKLNAAVESKQSELEKVLGDFQEANDRLLVISEELEKSKLVLSENETLKNERDQMKSQLRAKDDQLQSLEVLLQKKEAVEADGLRETVDQLQAELKVKSDNLEKLKQELQGKCLFEEELTKLRSVLQKTEEELENSKKLVDHNQGRAQELETALDSKNADVEKMQIEIQERERAGVEFQKLGEELQSKILQTEERLRLASEENDSLKKKIAAAEEALNGKVAELKIVQEQLHDKEQIEEQLSAAKERLQNLAEGNEQIGHLEKECEAFKSKMVEQEQRLSKKENELGIISVQLENSEQQKEDLLQEVEKLQKMLVESDSSIAELKAELDTVKTTLGSAEASAREETRKTNEAVAEIAKISETIECLQSENDVLREKIKSQFTHRDEELKARKMDIEKLQAEMEELKEMLNFKKMELEEINCVWAGKLNSLKVNLNSLGRSMHELGRLAVQLQETFVDKVLQLKNDLSFKTTTVLELSVADAKRELLDEMHRMNEVLKDRGNSISNLQELLSEAVTKSSSYKTQIDEIQSERNKALSEVKSKEDKLAAAESLIKELESEICRLKELKEPVPENDSLSTSTISRTEEHMRFKEVDDSIEEKYIKLRQVAVKLKKKSSELTQTLEQERSKFTSDRAELIDKIQHLSTVAKNAQKVQESYDKVLDELETLRKQNQTSSAAVKELAGNEESLKRRVATLESQNANIPLMAKQIDGLNHTIKDLKSEINRLEMEKKVEVMKYEEVKKQCSALESKSESLTQSLDQAVQQGRATNVLELEINNYEKVISDLTAQLNAEKQKLVNSEKEYASVSLVKTGLEEQISLLEEQVAAEESRNANLQEQVTSMRDKTMSSQQRIDELNDQVAALRRDLQQAKNCNEQQAFEMSSLSSEFSRKEIDLQSRIDSFTAHIQSLETTLVTIRQELSTSNSEKEHLREEFDSYRLRAQSMLARQKGDSVSNGEREAREQLDKLKKELDSAREKMENNQTETETLNNKLSSLQLEKARSDKRYEDVTKALHQKITDYDTLNTEYRAFKFSAETLHQNTKVEFEERVRQLKAENSSLKELVETLSRKSELNSSEFDLVPGPDFKNNNSSERQFFETSQSQDSAAVHLQEREDGEGSESVPPPLSNYRRLSNLVPLDILLNNPIDDENRIPVLQEQIEKLHGELHSYEVRVKHLASLLSEAEKDAARSSQQNAVLKEELRRLERSLQREPNIANSEYLKNVIFKFLVLQSGDERTRLVPVLDTILKLSPDETSKLTAVAKGDAASWGSYLHSWTGL